MLPIIITTLVIAISSVVIYREFVCLCIGCALGARSRFATRETPFLLLGNAVLLTANLRVRFYANIHAKHLTSYLGTAQTSINKGLRAK